jgi:hypothetical protein
MRPNFSRLQLTDQLIGLLTCLLTHQLTSVSRIMVGLGRLELPTSPLSGVRSSHLSYRPGLVSAGHLSYRNQRYCRSLVELVGIEPATS